MKNRLKKLTALLLVASMTVSMSGMVYASEAVGDVQEETEVVTAEAASEDAEAVVGVTAVAKAASELKAEAAELKTLEAGVDYADEEGIFLADSKEDAEKVAKEYGAEVKSYAHGVAVLDFNRSVVDAFTETAEAQATSTVVEPNYIDHFDTVNEEDLAKAIGEAAVNKATPVVKSDSVIGDKDAVVLDENEQPNDPFADKENGGYQWFHEKIHSLAAQEITTGEGVTVAVLDTGINTASAEFRGKIDVDATSRYKAKYKGEDHQGHGSNCSGLIGAIKNNGALGFGVAPDVNIYSVQISDGGGIYASDELEGMQMAIEKGVQVVSMSFGGPQYSASMQELCNQAAERGITLVAAAGNENTNAIHYPAGYDNVISVAAVDIDDTLSFFSNYGEWVDIAAPGGGQGTLFTVGNRVYIPDPNEPQKPDKWKRKTYNGEYYVGMAGTSQATPQVAAVAALMYAANSNFVSTKTIDTPRAIESLLMATTDNQSYVYEDREFTGLVQADAAVNAAKNYTGSTSYRIVDPSGDYGVYMAGKIGKGCAIKLSVGDVSGNNGSKSKVKAAWTSSDPTVLTVKNGVVRCNKNAIVGTKAYVTASVGSETVSYAFTVTEKIQTFGNIYVLRKRGAKNYTVKYVSRLKLRANANKYYDISDPYSFTGRNAYLTFDKKKHDIPGYYVAGGGFKYQISIPKGQLKNCAVYSANRNGDPRIIGFTKPGNYTIKYKVMDGSNKTFTLKLVVK